MFLAVSITILWLNKDVLVKAEEPADMPESIARINQLAKEARTGSSIGVTEELVTAAIEVAGFENELRGFTLSAIKDRVARADIRYRQEGTSGISEDRVDWMTFMETRPWPFMTKFGTLLQRHKPVSHSGAPGN